MDKAAGAGDRGHGATRKSIANWDLIEVVRSRSRGLDDDPEITEKSRSEGQGRAAEIRCGKERELKRITSEAYKTAQEIRGRADAEATRIYAEAYGRSPEFYAFLETLKS